MKKILILVVLLSVSSFSLHAQLSVLEERISGKTKPGEIMEIVSDYYEEIDRGERVLMDEPKFKHWARWAYWASMHTDGSGNVVNDPRFHLAALREFQRSENSRSSAGNWSSIGPSFVSSSVGSAIGIGRVDRIVFHPTNANIFYLCTPASGLLVTYNGGVNYTHLTDYLPTMSASGLVISHDNYSKLFLLTGDGDGGGFITSAGYRQYSTGVYVSYDGGTNWSITSPFPTAEEVTGYALVQDPVDPATLLAATNSGIYRTTDSGQTWNLVRSGKTYEIKHAATAPYYVYATQKERFYRSTNGGETWTQITQIDEPLQNMRIALAVTKNDPEAVYLFSGWSMTDISCTDDGVFGGIYYSDDRGASFTRRANTPNIVTGCCEGENGRTQANYDLALGVSHWNKNSLVTGALRVWKSSNGGVSMSASDPACTEAEGFIHVDVHDVEYNPLNNFVYACTDGGVYVSLNHGANWSSINTNLTNSQIYHMGGSLSNPNQIMIGLQDNGMMSFSSGTTWSSIWGGDGFDCIYDHNQTGSGYLSSNSQVVRFTSNGLSATSITPSSNVSFFPRLEIHRINADIVLAGYVNMQRSTDAGVSWTTLGISGNWDIESCPTNSNRFYAAGSISSFGNEGNMYRSNDQGVNWTNISNNTGFPDSLVRISDIEVSPVNSSVVYIAFAGFEENQKVYYSNNAGLNWYNLSGSLPNIPINAIQADASGNLYVGTDIGVFYRASDGDWVPFWHKLPNVPITDLELYENANIIRASTFGRGVWQSDTYSSCPSAYYLTINLNGRKYYEASESIHATNTFYGGENTDFTLKSGYEVVFGTGFQILKGNNLRAYIAPCGVSNN